MVLASTGKDRTVEIEEFFAKAEVPKDAALYITKDAGQWCVLVTSGPEGNYGNGKGPNRFTALRRAFDAFVRDVKGP